MKISIVLPAYNEELAIGKVIDDIQSAMAGERYDYEILVVDDNSTDKTSEIAKQKGVRVVHRAVNAGAGAARRTGIKAAEGDVIVMLDADGTYECKDIPKMLVHFPEYDQVNGARTSEKGTLKFLRFPAKWLIRQLACYLTGVNIPDLNTGLKAFKRDIMLKYLWVLPDGFSCVTTMTLAFLCNGYAVKYVPTSYHPRIGKSKFHPIRDTANYINVIVRMVMYFNPLRVFLPAAGILFLLGLIKTVLSLTSTESLQESDIIIFMTAIMVFSLGLIADLIVAHRKQD